MVRKAWAPFFCCVAYDSLFRFATLTRQRPKHTIRPAHLTASYALRSDEKGVPRGRCSKFFAVAVTGLN